MTSVVEIVVIGPVGSGKSHVLDMIERALRAEYGEQVNVVSPELESERRMGSPGLKPCPSTTVFKLKEGRLSLSGAEIDRDRFYAGMTVCGILQPSDGAVLLDPLEQAIDQAVRLLNESEGEMAIRLSRHLDALLTGQLRRVLGSC